ncbi:MAG TPA: hypothetical protein VJ728_10745 [Candidatus Binataceae bacterium]|nr:hypothetical protein [Candidatus Binataceae bacterium]
MRKNLNSFITGALGVMLMFTWAIAPVPAPKNLKPVTGRLLDYCVELDNSWTKKYLARNSNVYVLFRIAGVKGRFWNDAVRAGNVTSVLPHSGVLVSTYRVLPYSFSKINGDGEKTYGLWVDGTEIQSVDVALGGDSILAHYVLPGLGTLFLIFAWRTYKRDDSETAAPTPT